MATGYSIHIVLNGVDPNAYNGWAGTLAGCVNDANAMKAIADSFAYSSVLLLNEQATSAAVIQAIGRAAQQMNSEDILLLTYSGHGGIVDDVTGGEPGDDGKDETWVLYDRMLLDDELEQLWTQFADGARIFVLSDSCHSGTVTRELLNSVVPTSAVRTAPGAAPTDPRVRGGIHAGSAHPRPARSTTRRRLCHRRRLSFPRGRAAHQPRRAVIGQRSKLALTPEVM